jgi:parallel beta-helix repeat protein
MESRGQSWLIVDGIAMVRTYNSAFVSAPTSLNEGHTTIQGAHLTVRNCLILNYGSPYDRHFNDNAHDAGEGAIYMAGWHDSPSNHETALAGILIERNIIGRFDSRGKLDYDRAGIYVRNSTGAIIRNNTVKTLTAMGIRVADNYNNRTNDGALIEGNELGINQGNISLSACTACSVKHNTIHDSAGYGIGIGIGFFSVSTNTLLEGNTIRHLTASGDGLLYNGVDCNAGSRGGRAVENRIEAVANYSFTLEADKNQPCSGWKLIRNVLDASQNTTWNNKPTGRMGALYVRDLSMDGLEMKGNTLIASRSYDKAIALGSRNSSDPSKDISPAQLSQDTIPPSVQ